MQKTLKNILCLVLAMLLMICLAACGEEKPGETSGDKPSQQQPSQTTPSTEAPTTVPTTEAPTTEPKETVEEFFNNAAFIGDSVTLKLRNYNTKNGILGSATFLCQGSYSVGHAVNNTMFLSYQGEDMTPQDALAACGVNKVFILLGMNDIALYGIDKTIENWGTLIASIRDKNPDIDIYIQSGTPIYTEGQKGKLNNENMDKYNARLVEFARANGCVYIDIASPLKDSSNGLAKKYTSDDYVHFTDAACELWYSILKDIAESK